jgi:hypothetical protein
MSSKTPSSNTFIRLRTVSSNPWKSVSLLNRDCEIRRARRVQSRIKSSNERIMVAYVAILRRVNVGQKTSGDYAFGNCVVEVELRGTHGMTSLKSQ